MNRYTTWIGVLRALVVTGLLVIALLGAVLLAIHTRGYPPNWAGSPDAEGVAAPPPPTPGAMEYRIGAAPNGAYGR